MDDIEISSVPTFSNNEVTNTEMAIWITTNEGRLFRQRQEIQAS